MNVKELIAALQELPQDADVYISEPPPEGWTLNIEREPDASFEINESIRLSDRTRCYPHGRVKL